MLPFVLTIVFAIWLGVVFHKYVGPESSVGQWCSWIGLHFITSELGAYIFVFGFISLCLYLMGLLALTGFRNWWHRLHDQIWGKIPLIGTVYDAAKKLSSLFDKDANGQIKSMKPVLVKFGEPKGTVIPAFQPSPEIIEIKGVEYQCIMIPSAPIPFGGALFLVPADSVEEMDCGIDGLLNIYMSMGVTMPELLKDAPKAKDVD